MSQDSQRAKQAICSALFLLSYTGSTLAEEADVEAVSVAEEDGGTFRFDVTVQHLDEGWDHYADRWEVVGGDGTVFAMRILAHPHVNEQPFTRSLSGVEIPADETAVIVRARDSVHGYGGQEERVALPGR